ncbi:MAG: helix-turn-helix domain-containing protein [Alphaproteobacteria bacterium]
MSYRSTGTLIASQDNSDTKIQIHSEVTPSIDGDDCLISIKEACRLLGGKSRATIYRWADNGAFIIRKLPGTNSSAILKSDLLRHMRTLPSIKASRNTKRPRGKRSRLE